MIVLKQHERGVIVPVKAHAAARRNGVTGIRQGMVCISVTQVPEKGKANKAIAGELAKVLDVRSSEVSLHSGDTSPRKRFLVVGVTVAEIQSRLQQLITEHQ